MTAAVEQYTRARVLGDSTELPSIPVALRYDPGSGPDTVRLAFSGEGGNDWTFSRALLEEGLRAPAGTGDVRVWPCGRVQTVMEFHARGDVVMIQLDSSALLRFLRRTYDATAQYEAVSTGTAAPTVGVTQVAQRAVGSPRA
ncbi:SsgA family sporulation/cell division regulator [Streptomyces tsukubensis]|uniref:SsgA family sporulation/cell division regulator n=1 Tax=Streptomyces tsukubensis TaxID=83656 RepID=A0A1V4A4Q7_9ACTN|nr:SsgA family sporulation/cell division regulator [Streptomyces tsukubensis]OON75980.1 hypothetical protein B1H18_21860 [Streptomyces tsukubensis]QFR94072.1 SsgA family sporulation/cell division regulator [Streptomyces tsukubensis]